MRGTNGRLQEDAARENCGPKSGEDFGPDGASCDAEPTSFWRMTFCRCSSSKATTSSHCSFSQATSSEPWRLLSAPRTIRSRWPACGSSPSCRCARSSVGHASPRASPVRLSSLPRDRTSLPMTSSSLPFERSPFCCFWKQRRMFRLREENWEEKRSELAHNRSRRQNVFDIHPLRRILARVACDAELVPFAPIARIA